MWQYAVGYPSDSLVSCYRRATRLEKSKSGFRTISRLLVSIGLATPYSKHARHPFPFNGVVNFPTLINLVDGSSIRTSLMQLAYIVPAVTLDTQWQERQRILPTTDLSALITAYMHVYPRLSMLSYVTDRLIRMQAVANIADRTASQQTSDCCKAASPAVFEILGPEQSVLGHDRVGDTV